MNKARLDDVEARIKQKRSETIKAETEAREYAGTGTNEYPGIDICRKNDWKRNIRKGRLRAKVS